MDSLVKSEYIIRTHLCSDDRSAEILKEMIEDSYAGTVIDVLDAMYDTMVISQQTIVDLNILSHDAFNKLKSDAHKFKENISEVDCVLVSLMDAIDSVIITLDKNDTEKIENLDKLFGLEIRSTFNNHEDGRHILSIVIDENDFIKAYDDYYYKYAEEQLILHEITVGAITGGMHEFAAKRLKKLLPNNMEYYNKHTIILLLSAVTTYMKILFNIQSYKNSKDPKTIPESYSFHNYSIVSELAHSISNGTVCNSTWLDIGLQECRLGYLAGFSEAHNIIVELQKIDDNLEISDADKRMIGAYFSSLNELCMSVSSIAVACINMEDSSEIDDKDITFITLGLKALKAHHNRLLNGHLDLGEPDKICLLDEVIGYLSEVINTTAQENGVEALDQEESERLDKEVEEASINGYFAEDSILSRDLPSLNLKAIANSLKHAREVDELHDFISAYECNSAFKCIEYVNNLYK